MYENHICEPRTEELYESISSQLKAQLLQLRKKNSCAFNCDDLVSYNSVRSSHIWFSYFRNLYLAHFQCQKEFCVVWNFMACAIFVMSVYVLWVIFKRLVVLQMSFAV